MKMRRAEGWWLRKSLSMLNKMPKDSLARTGWERKSSCYRNLLSSGIVLLLFVIFANPVSRQRLECLYFHTPVNSTVRVGNRTVIVETVESEMKQAKGLGDRPCIKDNQAMLFVFDRQDTMEHCFWMKDMRFPIDIVWLSSEKQVIHVVSDVEPATYPASFCPGEASRYVFEVKSGQAAKLGLTVGTRLSF